jgi:hypothetical protein
VGSSLGAGTVEDGIGEDFAFVGGHLVVHAMGTGDTAFDPVAGRDLLLRAPLPYGNGAGPAEWFYLFEWLDDDSFALLDATSWNSGVYSGEDILVCRISSSRCNVAVHRPTSAGSPIVPGFGTPGAEIAAHRAALAQLSGR